MLGHGSDFRTPKPWESPEQAMSQGNAATERKSELYRDEGYMQLIRDSMVQSSFSKPANFQTGRYMGTVLVPKYLE